MCNKETILMVIAALSIEFAFGITTIAFNANKALRNRDAINCMDKYLRTQDKNYAAVIASCQAEQKENQKQAMRSIAN